MAGQTDKQILGSKGEADAVAFLRMQHYDVLAQNWRSGHLELDIVAAAGNRLVFVEVKSRGSDRWDAPEASVDLAKRKRMMRAATAFARHARHEGSIRFDIISLIYRPWGKQLLHIKDAFFPMEFHEDPEAAAGEDLSTND